MNHARLSHFLLDHKVIINFLFHIELELDHYIFRTQMNQWPGSRILGLCGFDFYIIISNINLHTLNLRGPGSSPPPFLFPLT